MYTITIDKFKSGIIPDVTQHKLVLNYLKLYFT